MDYKNKRVAILGLGIEGQDAVEFFYKKGAQVTGYDRKEASGFKNLLLKYKSGEVKLIFGEDYLVDGLTSFDLIVRSPGVKLNLACLVEARKKGVEVTSPTQLFFDLCPAKIIGVTGTKGKGTTATLISNFLEADVGPTYLLGNIGAPSLGMLSLIESDFWVVYELSSFQLQDLPKSPQISVVLFIATDHLDYHSTREEYVEAKSQIVRHQKKEDIKIVDLDDATASSFSNLGLGQTFSFSRHNEKADAYVEGEMLVLKINGQRDLVGSVHELKLIGEHNWDNVLAACLAARLAGCSPKSIREEVIKFTGLPHRLEKVGEVEEVEFYNDSFSTTPETAMAAVRSFKKPVVLIAGGSDKGADFSKLGQVIADSTVKTLMVIGLTGPKIAQAAQEAGFKGLIVEKVGGMFEAVQKAFLEAVPDG
ncbi:UDP-N-acetylmuramoyl-L-alanine--D-glutamate ligase, partial [Patescibacteria group bacterium]|nr:UDP-N-acetylmuramoyl-L-alanine--D-glutamate ligase [Patescibacteria group bacterium]